MNRIMTTMIGMLVIMLLTAGAAAADIPRLISFQGRLSDTQGLPLTGSYDLTFRLYTASAGGAAIWTEAQSGIGVSNGIYNVYLGEVTPLDALSFDTPYWISVEVFTDGEMTPRRRLTATGYALRAVAAETATTVAGSGTVSSAQLTVTDTATINGKLGVGTETGQYQLTVFGDAYVSETFTVGDSKLVVTPDGLVGINDPLPATALDVAGTVTATAFAGDGSNLTGISSGSIGEGVWKLVSKVTGNGSETVTIAIPSTYDYYRVLARVNLTVSGNVCARFSEGNITPASYTHHYNGASSNVMYNATGTDLGGVRLLYPGNDNSIIDFEFWRGCWQNFFIHFFGRSNAAGQFVALSGYAQATQDVSSIQFYTIDGGVISANSEFVLLGIDY